MKTEIKQELGTNNIEKRLLKPAAAAVAKVEAQAVNGATQYCEKNEYQHILRPYLSRASGACENFSTLFSTDMFGKTAYLSQTGQLFLEGFMPTYEKTYCFGPSFRKEIKADPRHLTEFTLFEIEVAGMNLRELQKEISNIFGSMIENVEATCKGELSYLLDDTSMEAIKPPYKAITYEEAIARLHKYELSFGDDLKSEHEAYLVEQNDGKPLFITHFPKKIKFFNMRVNREDSRIVNSMDLLMPDGGEAVGAAEREEDYEYLQERLAEAPMIALLEEAIVKEKGFEHYKGKKLFDEAMSRFDWYGYLIKENPIKHSGCGIGIGRVVQSMLKTNDIRYSTAFAMNRETLF